MYTWMSEDALKDALSLLGDDTTTVTDNQVNAFINRLLELEWNDFEHDYDTEVDLLLTEEPAVLDAKLSTEQRTRLASSTFCGPNRSFPVPDCAHVTAACRLINRAKVSNATKAKILASVDRKTKALGCGSTSTTDSVTTPETPEVVDHVALSAMTDSALLDMATALRAVMDKRDLQSEGFTQNVEKIEQLTSELSSTTDNKEALEGELAELKDSLKYLRRELTSAYGDVETDGRSAHRSKR